jgi:hypothetical protein
MAHRKKPTGSGKDLRNYNMEHAKIKRDTKKKSTPKKGTQRRIKGTGELQKWDGKKWLKYKVWKSQETKAAKTKVKDATEGPKDDKDQRLQAISKLKINNKESGSKAKVSDYMDKPKKDPYSTSALADKAAKTKVKPKKKVQRDAKGREIETYFEDGKFKWRPKKNDSQKVDEKGKGVPKKKEDTWEGKASNRPRPGSAGARIQEKLRKGGFKQEELDRLTKATADRRAAKKADKARKAEVERARKQKEEEERKKRQRTGGE